MDAGLAAALRRSAARPGLLANAMASLEQRGLVKRVLAAGCEMTSREIPLVRATILRRFDLPQIRQLQPQAAVVVLRHALHEAVGCGRHMAKASFDDEAGEFFHRGRAEPS